MYATSLRHHQPTRRTSAVECAMLSKAFLRTSARGFASKSTPGLKNVVLIDGCRIPFQPCTRLLPAPNRPIALQPCARCACGARQTGPRTMWT